MLPDPRAAYGCDHRILCENGRECMGIVARRIAYTVLFFARTWCNEDRCIEALYLHERHSGTNSHLRIGRLVLLVRCIGTPEARAIRKLARSRVVGSYTSCLNVRHSYISLKYGPPQHA